MHNRFLGTRRKGEFNVLFADWMQTIQGDNTEVCLTLTKAQVQALLAMSGYFRWKTRYYNIPPQEAEAINQALNDWTDQLETALIDWQPCEGEPVSNFAIRVSNCILEYTTDGINWTPATGWDASCFEGPQGPIGPAGESITGPQGPQGIQGPPGVDGVDGADCVCPETPIDIGGSTETTPFTSDNEICGGMLQWRETLWNYANYFLDVKEDQQNAGLVAARVVALFPFLLTLESDLVDLFDALTSAVISNMRVLINDPVFMDEYLCGAYNLVYPAGSYTLALHEAFADATLVPPITTGQQLMDHVLWLVGYERMNKAFRIGALEPSDACSITCEPEPDPGNPLNLEILNGEICSVIDLGNGAYRYTFLSLYNDGNRGTMGHWITVRYPGFNDDVGMLTINKTSTKPAECTDERAYANHTPYMTMVGKTSGQIFPHVGTPINVKRLELYGNTAPYYHTFDIGVS